MLPPNVQLADGLYRLVKWREDGNPAFPSNDTVVEIRAGTIVNLSTGRCWSLDCIGAARSLFGPIRNPYDVTKLKRLPRVDFLNSDMTMPGAARPHKVPRPIV